MFDFQVFSLYIGIVFVFLIGPGPSVFLVMEHGLRFGLYQTLQTIVGTLISNIIWILAACGGTSILIYRYPASFSILQISGACYLLYLGWKRLNGAYFRKKKTTESNNLFLEGLCVSLSNPKSILFFASLFPIFIKNEQPIFQQIFFLIIIFLVLAFFVLLGYAILGKVIARFWLNSKNCKIIETVLGTILMGFGAWILIYVLRSLLI